MRSIPFRHIFAWNNDDDVEEDMFQVKTTSDDYGGVAVILNPASLSR